MRPGAAVSIDRIESKIAARTVVEAHAAENLPLAAQQAMVGRKMEVAGHLTSSYSSTTKPT